jgi:hypothetical protein
MARCEHCLNEFFLISFHLRFSLMKIIDYSLTIPKRV